MSWGSSVGSYPWCIDSKVSKILPPGISIISCFLEDSRYLDLTILQSLGEWDIRVGGFIDPPLKERLVCNGSSIVESIVKQMSIFGLGNHGRRKEKLPQLVVKSLLKVANRARGLVLGVNCVTKVRKLIRETRSRNGESGFGDSRKTQILWVGVFVRSIRIVGSRDLKQVLLSITCHKVVRRLG